MSQAPLAASLPTTAAPAAGGMTNTVAPAVATDAFAEMFAIALKAVMNPTAAGGATSLESVLQNITTQLPSLVTADAPAVPTDGLLPQPVTLPPEMMQELEKINFESLNLPELTDLASQFGVELPQLELPETPKIELSLPAPKADVAQAFTAPTAAELIQSANLASNLDATEKPVAATSAQAILAAIPMPDGDQSADAGEIDLASLSVEINEDEILKGDDFSNELPPAIVPDFETLSLVAPRDVAKQIITASVRQQAAVEPVAVQQPNPALEDLAKKIVARMLSSAAPVAPSVNVEEVEAELPVAEPKPVAELATPINPFPTIVVPTNTVETEPVEVERETELPVESRSQNFDAVSAAQILASAGSSIVAAPANEVVAASPSPLAIGSIDAADLEVSISASTLASIGETSILPEELGVSSTNVSLEDVEAMLGRKASDLPPPAAIIASAETSVEGASLSDQNAAVLANIDRVEFVDRMSQALRRAHLQSPKALELELHPPALGKVIIQVVNENGQLTARIEAHSQAARNLLMDNMPGLERNLSDHGITFQRLAVEQPQSNAQTGNQQQGAPDQRQGQPNSQQQNSQQQRQQGSNEQRPSASVANDVDEGSRRKSLTMSDLLAMAPGMDRTI